MPYLLLATICAMATLSTACAAETDPEGDDEVASEEQAIKNQSITGRKICVRVKNDTKLYRHPEGNETITTTSRNGATLVSDDANPRYALVQARPGRVGTRVWADPDLNGLRSDEDIPKLAERCRISVAAAKRAAAVVVKNKYTRRAWVDVRDLGGNLAKNLDASLSNGPAFEKSDLDGAGKPKNGVVRKVRAQCLPQGEYRGSNPKDPPASTRTARASIGRSTRRRAPRRASAGATRCT